ncbi:MAG: hypothetical protein HQ472_02260 [Ignavibacteria bacterium]|nr:hypothetical protein [Ignavibacteria bacterium]
MNYSRKKIEAAATFVLVLLFLCTVNVLCQTDTLRMAEEQVPVDEVGRVYVIDSNMQANANVFREVKNLFEARLYMRSDSTYIAYLTVRKESRLLTEQTPVSAQEVKEIRRAVQQFVDSKIPSEGSTTTNENGLDQEGRTSLLVGSTLWSLFYYGTATNFAINYNETESTFNFNAFTYLFAGGLGYFVPLLLTNNAPVSAGASSLALGGMFQGVLHGWGMAMLVQGDNIQNPRLGFGLSVATGVAETIAGYMVATKHNISEGDAGILSTTSFYGLVSGGLVSALVTKEFTTDLSVRLAGGLGLLGGAAGLLLGNSIRSTQNFTSSDASIYATSGLLGLALPYVIIAAVNPNNLDIRVVAGTGIIGIAAGLFTGLQIVKGRDYTGSAGTLTMLSTVAGGLIGLGTSSMLDLNSSSTPIVTYAFAAAGFTLAVTVLTKYYSKSESRSNLQFNVNPLAPLLASSFNGNNSVLFNPNNTVPFVSASWKF